MKLKVLFLGLLFFCKDLYAVRPIITEDPPTVGENVFSIESGVSYDNKNPSYDVTLLYGFTKDLEIAIKTNYVGRDDHFYNGAHLKYSFDFIAFKAEYLKNINLHESALSLGFTKYLYNKGEFYIFGSIGFSKNTPTEDTVSYSLASSLTFRDKVFYIDLFFESNTNDFSVFKRHIFRPLFGFNYSFSQKLVFDLGYMFEIYNKKKISDNYIAGLTLYL